MNSQTFLMASRPKTLWCTVAPVLIGTLMAWADGKVHWESALGCLLMGLFVQVATNFHNDYYDFEKGTDTKERLGPKRVTLEGLATPQQMAKATFCLFVCAGFCACCLSLRCGWPMLAICTLSILSGWAYTGGPSPLAYNGWADVFVVLFFGPVAVGATYYAQALEWSIPSLIAGLAPGLLCAAVLTLNNLRDVDQDRKGGRRTLAVRFGRSFARGEYVVCFILASCIPGVLSLQFGYGSPFLGFLLLPLAWPNVKVAWSAVDGPSLNQALHRTGKLLMVYTLLFTAGFAL